MTLSEAQQAIAQKANFNSWNELCVGCHETPMMEAYMTSAANLVINCLTHELKETRFQLFTCIAKERI